MSTKDPLAKPRAARNRARAEWKGLLVRAKIDLAPAALKRRVVVEAQRSALSAAQQAIEIANDSRGVVAATGGVLALWLARKPIFAGANTLLDRLQRRKSPADRVKLLIADYWGKLKEYADE